MKPLSALELCLYGKETTSIEIDIPKSSPSRKNRKNYIAASESFNSAGSERKNSEIVSEEDVKLDGDGGKEEEEEESYDPLFNPPPNLENSGGGVAKLADRFEYMTTDDVSRYRQHGCVRVINKDHVIDLAELRRLASRFVF